MRAPHANLLGADETSQLGRTMAEQDDTLVLCCLRAMISRDIQFARVL